MDLKDFEAWRTAREDSLICTGFRHYRTEQDEPYYDDERKFVAEFNDENRKTDYELSMLIHGPKDRYSFCGPKEWVTDHEKKIIMTTIQWLGTPVGKSFLSNCGFEKVKPK